MVRAISGKASLERGIFMDETSRQLAAEEIVDKVVFEAQLKQVVDDARRWKAHQRAAASDGQPQPAAEMPFNVPLQSPTNESQNLLQLAGGLALIFKFDPQARRSKAIGQILHACERFCGLDRKIGTVRTWVSTSSAFAMAPEKAKQLPLATLCKLNTTKVKTTLYQLIQGMVADRYGFGRPLTNDRLKEIQDDLGQVGVSMELADLRQTLGKIDDELGQPRLRSPA